MTPGSIEDFEKQLLHLSVRTHLPLKTLPILLGDIAGVMMQEARRTIFEDGEDVVFDPSSVRDELIRMGHDADSLQEDQVRLLLDFFLEEVVDPRSARN